MDKKVNILKSRPFITTFLSILLFSICSYHFLTRVGIDLELLISLSALMVLISLGNEAKIFFVNIIQEPKKYFLIICILVSSIGGLSIIFTNIVEISFFIILFFSIYLIFLDRDRDLVNLVTNLVICSGVFMSIGVVIGLFESIFLSSKIFYYISDHYPGIPDRPIYQGFGFNQNYSAYIIVIAQSFLFLSHSTLSRKLRNYLTLLFALALLITGARIVFLFFSLIACNYFFKKRINKYLIGTILISLFLLLSHIIIAEHGTYELGSGPHYRELLYSIGNIDFVLAQHGYLKVVYLTELKENFFFPVNLTDITNSLAGDPHSLIFSLIILGGFPLALSVGIFLVLGMFKNFVFIEQKYSNFYYPGLISIITESFMWDAANSIFFWIITLYAVMISENSLKNFENKV